MQEDSGLYEIVVAVVGTATVMVQANSEGEAMMVAEACVTPMNVHHWEYVADEVLSYPAERKDAEA